MLKQLVKGAEKFQNSLEVIVGTAYLCRPKKGESVLSVGVLKAEKGRVKGF